MITRLFYVVFVALAIFAGGCTMQSFHPFCEEKDAIEIPELHGKWKLMKVYDEEKSDKQIGEWEISSGKIVCFDDENIKSELQTSFFKVGETVFANVTAGEIKEGKDGSVNMYWLMGVTPVNIVGKFVLSGDDLLIIPADYDEVKRRVQDGRIKLPHVKRINDPILFTATTADLKKFVTDNKDDQDIFPLRNALVLKRVKKQTEEGK